MTITELVNLFKEKPYYKRMGRNNIAKRLGVTIEEVTLAKEQAYSKAKTPRVLILDIETAPLLAYVFGLRDVNIGINKIESDWYIICWSAKWLGEDEIMSCSCDSAEAIEQNDKEVCEELAKLLNEADIVITHNGDKFDLPRINTRFILNNLNPPTPYISIDTCKVARRYFNFSSNKLDFLATKFGLKNKLDTGGFDLWRQCYMGKEEALYKMIEYNQHDVVLLEEVYFKLRPWIKNHPSFNLYKERPFSCPKCGGSSLEHVGYHYTKTSKYKTFRCKCGGLSRTTTNTYKPNNKLTLTSI